MTDLSKLSEPLPIDSVEFRVQSINKGGYAKMLAYKDARVDQQRLDDVVGPTNWQRRHVNGNHNCVVSIWCDTKKEWVSKEDTGTESNTEKEKGLASDSFKRACFNWGIGRELYSYPDINVKLKEDEFFLNEKNKDKYGNPKPTATWKLNPKDWIWYSEFTHGCVSYLGAKQGKELRFQWGKPKGKK